MKRLVLALLLLLPAPLAGQYAPKAGAVHCTSVEALRSQAEALRSKGIRAQKAIVAAMGEECHEAERDERFTAAEPAGEWREKLIVCLRSEAWDGCRYSFREDLWEPS